jgi:prepilin-type N-terminal cleavage/methylation domain-containing protein
MNTKSKGLALAELIVVMAVMGVLLTAATLSVSSSGRFHLSAAMRDLQGDLRYARKLAMAESAEAQILFDVPANSYRLQKQTNGAFVTIKTVRLAKARLDSTSATNNRVRYTARGTTGDACTVTLSTDKYTCDLTVNVGSGRAAIKNMEKK